MARHFHPAHDRARKQSLPDRAVATMPSFGAVCHVTTTKAVAFHDTFKAASFGNSDRIHIITFCEKRRANYIARFHFFGKITEFFDPFHRNGTEFFDMTEQRFGHPAFLLIFKTELNSLVAVAFDGLALDHAVGPGEHDRDGNQHALFVIDAGLAEFFSKESEHRIKF